LVLKVAAPSPIALALALDELSSIAAIATSKIIDVMVINPFTGDFMASSSVDNCLGAVEACAAILL
jgi:hypothetical protein